MLIQGDANALEIRVAAFLSQDPVMIGELIAEKDLHTDNQVRLGLPDRGTAKTFVFRLIYGGGAWSYANDPDFAACKFNEKQWQKVIDAYYDKYKGLYKWHTKIVQEVTLTGKLVMPTGREYEYVPKVQRGEKVWPRTTILNYPVQGLGADVMAIARVSLFNRLKTLNIPEIKLINTVHDSIIVDAPDQYTDTIANMMLDVFEAVPRNFQKLFGVEFNVPMKAEVEIGQNWKDMEKYR